MNARLGQLEPKCRFKLQYLNNRFFAFSVKFLSIMRRSSRKCAVVTDHEKLIATLSQETASHGQAYPFSTCFKLHSQKKKRHKTQRWCQVTPPALSLHPRKYCVPLRRSNIESPNPQPKWLKVSKRRPSTARDILLGHVSKDILQKKTPQNSPVAPSYVPGEKNSPLEIRENFGKILSSRNETLQNVSKPITHDSY